MHTMRQERAGDTTAIHDVHRLAFGRTAEADLVDRLRSSGKLILSLVAEADGAVVGHIAFSPVTIESDQGAEMALGLAPVAVLPAWQRKGIGSDVVRRGLEGVATRRESVVVLGHPAFYVRFGFVPASQFGLRSEYDAGDAFMVRMAEGREIAAGGGLVRYAPEFQGV